MNISQPLSPASDARGVILQSLKFTAKLKQMNRKILGGAQHLIRYDFINLYLAREKKKANYSTRAPENPIEYVLKSCFET